MKAILLTTVFAVALHGQAIAEDLPAVAEIATNSLSHEMTQCFVFHNVVAACLLRGNDKKTAEQASKSAGVFLDYAIWLGKRAGISKLKEVIEARRNMAQKDLLELIDRDCRNISIALDKYGDRCKAIADDPSAALAEYIAQAEQRLPKKGSAAR